MRSRTEPADEAGEQAAACRRGLYDRSRRRCCGLGALRRRCRSDHAGHGRLLGFLARAQHLRQWGWSDQRRTLVARSHFFADFRATQALDFQMRYLDAWLRFIGITDIHTVRAAPTFGPAETVDAAMETAADELRRIAGEINRRDDGRD